MTVPSLGPDLDVGSPAEREEIVRAHWVRRLVRNPAALISAGFLLVVVLAAIFAPLLTPHDPTAASLQDVLADPSAAHPLGADGSGRDVLARLIYGGRFTLAGALLATAVAALLGVGAGLLAGYYGRFLEAGSSWTASLVLALPAIVVLLAARAVLGSSLWMAMLVMGVLLYPAFYRLVYAASAGVRKELYIDAAQVSGVPDRTIVSRHVLRVVRAPIIIQAASLMAIVIGVQAGIDFLGLGDPSTPSWGSMLGDAFTQMYRKPLLLVWPSAMIILTSIALAVFATALRDVLSNQSPSRRRRRRSAARADAASAAKTLIATPHTTDDDAREIVEKRDPSSADLVLDVDGLAVEYALPNATQRRVVHDVSLSLAKGEIRGLIGESGSGKTQTAWSILRLLPERGRIGAGTIRFDGLDLSTLSDSQMGRIRGRSIAYIPQEPMSNLAPSFTIGSQLVDPIRHSLGLNRQDAKAKVLALLARVGIADPERVFRAYPHEISGGMAQRVLIAGAVSCDPSVLIADEPTTALDVTVQAEVLDLLRDLREERGLAVLIVTHNFGVVADLCDTVTVMRHGRVVEEGTVESVFSSPHHEYTRSLLDAVIEDGLDDASSVLWEAVR